MRNFHVNGPVDPNKHYHVDRIAVKADLYAYIEEGKYITLNASRQTGKTTLFHEVVAELEATDDYFGILLDFEMLKSFEGEYFYEELARYLNRWRTLAQPSAPEPQTMRHHGDFVWWLRNTVETLGKKGVVIIDEFDSAATSIIEPLLSLFRGMYLQKNYRASDVIHSIIVVGVRDLPSLLGGTQSPFNIADPFTVPYFPDEEIAALLQQHTDETGQAFEPDVVTSIAQDSGGQPFLVNRLGQILTQDVVPDRTQPITMKDLDYGLARLVTENNTHFYSIVSKATPHRKLLLPMLFYNQTRTDFLDPATQELIMYGVLRVYENEENLQLARVGNPIYRKMLLLRFAPPTEEIPINGKIANRHVIDDVLNFDGVLDEYKAFMTEHGVPLIKSAKTGRPLEISGQYLLLSYLTAALNSIAGSVTIESLSKAGEMDILAFHRGNRFIVETKVWYDKSKYEAGKQQLLRYIKSAGLEKGYMVIFDEQLEKNPLLTEEGEVFDVEVDDKLLRIYLVNVSVE